MIFRLIRSSGWAEIPVPEKSKWQRLYRLLKYLGLVIVAYVFVIRRFSEALQIYYHLVWTVLILVLVIPQIQWRTPKTSIYAYFDRNMLRFQGKVYKIKSENSIVITRTYAIISGGETEVTESLILEQNGKRTVLAHLQGLNSGVHIAARRLARGFDLELLDETGIEPLKLHYDSKNYDLLHNLKESRAPPPEAQVLPQGYNVWKSRSGLNLRYTRGPDEPLVELILSYIFKFLPVVVLMLMVHYWEIIEGRYTRLTSFDYVALAVFVTSLPSVVSEFHPSRKIVFTKDSIRVGGHFFVFKELYLTTLNLSEYQYVSLTQFRGLRVELVGDKQRYVLPEQFTQSLSDIDAVKLKHVLESAISQYCV